MKLTLAEYARHRNCNPKSVAYAIKRGRIKLGEDKLIDAEQADKDWAKNTNHAMARYPDKPQVGAFNNKRHRLGPVSKLGATYADSRARKEAIEAALKQLDLDEREGRLINREKAEAAYQTIGRKLRDAMLNLAPRISAQLAATSDARDCFEILDGAVKEVLVNFLSDVKV